MSNIKPILEAALMVAGRSLSLKDMRALFTDDERPERAALEEALQAIEEDCADKGYELKVLASGYQFQAKEQWGPWVARLWQEKPPKLSKALLETLAIIAYRQPITRADIEEIRGVATSTTVIKTLLENHWIKVVAYRDVPGKPALLGTTTEFLDHFNLQSLDELPSMEDLISQINLSDEATEDSSNESLSTEGEPEHDSQIDSTDESQHVESSVTDGDLETIVAIEDEIAHEESAQELVQEA